MFGLVVSIAVVAALGTSGSARADGEWWEPKCDTYANDPYTSNDVVAGFGGIHCSAGGSDWAARWWIEVCLQKWVRPDDQFYDVVCTYDWTEDEERRIGANLIAPADCSVGYGEYRIVVHSQWFVDYWHNTWAISNVAWACPGH
jgi:hypothetical protein